MHFDMRWFIQCGAATIIVLTDLLDTDLKPSKTAEFIV